MVEQFFTPEHRGFDRKATPQEEREMNAYEHQFFNALSKLHDEGVVTFDEREGGFYAKNKMGETIFYQKIKEIPAIDRHEWSMGRDIFIDGEKQAIPRGLFELLIHLEKFFQLSPFQILKVSPGTLALKDAQTGTDLFVITSQGDEYNAPYKVQDARGEDVHYQQ